MVIIPVRSKEPKFDSAAAHHDLHFRWSSLFLDDDGYGKDLALPNPHGKETSMFSTCEKLFRNPEFLREAAFSGSGCGVCRPPCKEKL